MSNSAFIYQPQIIRETAEGLNRLDIRDDMLSRRELELTCAVDADSCATVIRGLLYLERRDADAPVTLYINSPGGEVQSGLALYDVMQAVSCPIRTVCLGMAASMGALLFIAGDERWMLPHSRVMIHDPLIGGAGIGGSALSVKARADDLMRIRDITASVIARHTGMPLERVFELTANDTYFDAEHALEAGLADRIVTSL
jgi:ATP-dependent Clp protease, protease subunit